MTIKRSAAITLMALVATGSPVWAVFLGVLKQNAAATATVTNNNLSGAAAVTVFLINQRDDVSEVVPYTVPANPSLDIPVTVGTRISRVILLGFVPAKQSVRSGSPAARWR